MHSIWSDILWNLRFVPPFALGCAGLAVMMLTLWLLTKWREFMLVGLTAGLYAVPFITFH